MPLNWLVRAVMWVRNPPSMRMVLLVLGVVLAALALYGCERVSGWPEALTVEPVRRGPLSY